jgi:hypothetical protein
MFNYYHIHTRSLAFLPLEHGMPTPGARLFLETAG